MRVGTLEGVCVMGQRPRRLAQVAGALDEVGVQRAILDGVVVNEGQGYALASRGQEDQANDLAQVRGGTGPEQAPISGPHGPDFSIACGQTRLFAIALPACQQQGVNLLRGFCERHAVGGRPLPAQPLARFAEPGRVHFVERLVPAARR